MRLQTAIQAGIPHRVERGSSSFLHRFSENSLEVYVCVNSVLVLSFYPQILYCILFCFIQLCYLLCVRVCACIRVSACVRVCVCVCACYTAGWTNWTWTQAPCNAPCSINDSVQMQRRRCEPAAKDAVACPVSEETRTVKCPSEECQPGGYLSALSNLCNRYLLVHLVVGSSAYFIQRPYYGDVLQWR